VCWRKIAISLRVYEVILLAKSVESEHNGIDLALRPFPEGKPMTDSQPYPFARPYRCRDCGREVGVRSSPRTLAERYILPLLLMRPVRCAECFRRDYRMIFTPVRERSEGDGGQIHRNAA